MLSRRLYGGLPWHRYNSELSHVGRCELKLSAEVREEFRIELTVETHSEPRAALHKRGGILKVRVVEDKWNTRDPEQVASGYAEDCYWRNRSEFLHGRSEVLAFLIRKWNQELEYRLIKEIWAFEGSRIAVRFAYESHNDSGQWRRSYGNENWEFAPSGLMKFRHASINDLPIKDKDRLFHWPLGRRPDDHPGLTELGL